MAETETLRPDGNGTYSELMGNDTNQVNNYLLVDEDVADDGTTYVYLSGESAYKTDTYAIADSGVGAGTINHVKVYARCKTSWGVNQYKLTVYVDGTRYYGTEGSLGAWALLSYQWDTNPAGGSWSWADVDALEAGISFSNPANGTPKSWCTQVYVEVEYTEAVTFIPTVTII